MDSDSRYILTAILELLEDRLPNPNPKPKPVLMKLFGHLCAGEGCEYCDEHTSDGRCKYPSKCESEGRHDPYDASTESGRNANLLARQAKRHADAVIELLRVADKIEEG